VIVYFMCSVIQTSSLLLHIYEKQFQDLCRFTSSDKVTGCYTSNRYWMRQQVSLLFDFVSIINIEVPCS
jgi:hypothetical protein